MIRKKKKKKIKVKFKKVAFKLSERQVTLIDRHCLRKKTTRNKLIKDAIKDYFKYNSLPAEENYVTENQLQLFDDSKSHDKQELGFID